LTALVIRDFFVTISHAHHPWVQKFTMTI